jgi:hypothetical protein
LGFAVHRHPASSEFGVPRSGPANRDQILLVLLILVLVLVVVLVLGKLSSPTYPVFAWWA